MKLKLQNGRIAGLQEVRGAQRVGLLPILQFCHPAILQYALAQ
jgi:hypothetical protein